jgi:glycosyltransferase involved in cell wall biosynthesis
MKKVLVVTCHFPPDASVGALRPQKFVKHLPELGWTPHVLTVEERYHSALDPSRLADVRSARVLRTRVLPSPWGVLLGARGALFRAFGRGRALEARADRNVRMSFQERDRVSDGLGSSLRRVVLSLGRLPDDQIGWLLTGVIHGLRIVRRESIDALLTSGPPHTAHLIGFWLKRLTGRRWVAELRDPWVDNPGKPRSFRSTLSDRLDARMERAVVRAADVVILLTDRSRDSFLRRYPGEAAGKFVTLTNGFDADDFEALGSTARDPGFTIAHVGTLYFRRSPKALFEAVASLVREGKIPASSLRVVLAGEIADGHLAEVAATGLGDMIVATGRVSHEQALAWMLRADLLCLFAQGQPEQIPAKAFEYLAAGPPVLAITGEGATGDLVLKSGGLVVPDEAWAIADAIHQHYLARAVVRASRRVTQPWLREEVRAYDRRALTGQLAMYLAGGAS